MRIYETMFIIDPNLDDAAREEMANRVKTWIEEKVKGKIRSFDRWGVRQLAFRVDKFLQGDYTVTLFDAEPLSLKPLEEMYRITPQIFRWMIFRREDIEKHPPVVKKEEEEVVEKVETDGEVKEVEKSETIPEVSVTKSEEVSEGEGS